MRKVYHTTPEPLNRNESGRFGAVKSDSTYHFFGNVCTKSGSLRFSQFSDCWLILSVYIYIWVLTFPLEDCSEFGNFVITLIYCYLCLFANSDVQHVLTIWVTRLVSYNRQELLTLREHLGSLRLLMGSVLLPISDFVFCFSLSVCGVLNIASVSGLSILDCLFGFL
jgi:hypothetical protein